MTPEEKERLDEIYEFIGIRLAQIAEVVPAHHLTLVMRHPTNPLGSAVCTDDDDLNAVIETVKESKACRTREMN